MRNERSCPLARMKPPCQKSTFTLSLFFVPARPQAFDYSPPAASSSPFVPFVPTTGPRHLAAPFPTPQPPSETLNMRPSTFALLSTLLVAGAEAQNTTTAGSNGTVSAVGAGASIVGNATESTGAGGESVRWLRGGEWEGAGGEKDAVTVLGRTRAGGDWRGTKAEGGGRVESPFVAQRGRRHGEVLCALSSPRLLWHRGADAP